MCANWNPGNKSVSVLATAALIYTQILFSPVASAETFRVGVAANFSKCLLMIETAFMARYPEHRLQYSTAASGVLYAQIISGAPFDLFLSAENRSTNKLMVEGKGRAQITYALGRLVLWAPGAGKIDESFLENYKGPLAIANPSSAPYGQAAISLLQVHYGSGSMKIIRGNNIAQAYQYVASGNADAGLVALSLTLPDCMRGQNCWIIPAHYYPPIRQNAVLLSNNSGAKAFFDFLGSKAAREIIVDNGYGVESSKERTPVK